jgi:signal transduction histidine kinase
LISADQTRIKQALMNLIRNAINFTPEGGKIHISAEKKGDGVEISIKDTGIGIPADDLRRIFEPFVRAPAGRSGTTNGAGLGLALVKNIVELHGGSIDIESHENQGTTVTVFLQAL